MMRILVGTDFSPAANRAVQRATAWAMREGAALRVVHVVPPKRWLSGPWRTDVAALSAVHRHASLALKRLADTLDPSRQLNLSTGVVTGQASGVLVNAARNFGADVLVIGARGEHAARTRHPSLGGSALKLLATTPVPLFLVRSASTDAPKCIMAAVDLSAVSGAVLAWACRCAARGALIDVVHVYDVPFAARLKVYGVSKGAVDLYSREEQLQRERTLGTLIATACGDAKVQRVVERGNPIDCIFQRIREIEPDLVVLGKHSRDRRRQSVTQYGSVGQHIYMSGPRDLLVVPRLSTAGMAWRK